MENKGVYEKDTHPKDPELVEDEKEEFGDKIIELPGYDGSAFELGDDDEYIEVTEEW